MQYDEALERKDRWARREFMGVIRVGCTRREEKGRRPGFEFGSLCAFSVSFLWYFWVQL